jgi:hypothetical protein
VIALPAGHRLARQRSLGLEHLRDESWVSARLSSPAAEHRRFVQEQCAQAGFEPHVRYEINDSPTALGLIAAGLAIGLMPTLAFTPPPPCHRHPPTGKRRSAARTHFRRTRRAATDPGRPTHAQRAPARHTATAAPAARLSRKTADSKCRPSIPSRPAHGPHADIRPPADLPLRQAAHETQPPDLRPPAPPRPPRPSPGSLCADEPRLRRPPDDDHVA